LGNLKIGGGGRRALYRKTVHQLNYARLWCADSVWEGERNHLHHRELVQTLPAKKLIGVHDCPPMMMININIISNNNNNCNCNCKCRSHREGGAT
jgi:hypothetical protein